MMIKDMEFKGTQRAEKYSKGSGSIQSYSDYLSGYNQALKDSKYNEMLEMLQRIENILTYDTIEPNLPLQEEICNLIKQATEL